jgi:NAD(P)-dependent dehydrogenase (short-subunit alcohol dehydrogenase family)
MTRVALVVGATGGLGPAISRRLATDGLEVVVTSRDPDRSRALADAPGLHAETCDITVPHSIAELVERIVARTGRLDVVVANAGTRVVGPITDVPAAAWQHVLTTNLLGPAYLVAATAGWLTRSDSGRLVLLSSVSAIRPLPGRAPYTAGKAGIDGLVRAVAAELGPTGVTVNAVAPGLTSAGMALQAESQESDYLPRLLGQIPIGRPGTPEEIAAAVSFLASPEAGYITGQTLLVDGGWSTSAPGQVPTGAADF